MPDKYHGLVVPGQSYHLFNRAPGKEKMFSCAANYRFFLERLFLLTSSVAEYYCYCLLPNHFHLMTRIKPKEVIISEYERIKNASPPKYDLKQLSEFVMERFSNAFNSYTKSFNKIYARKGNLFMNYTRRVEASSNEYRTKLIHYIHTNPVHHGLCKKAKDWKYSSFNTFYLPVHTNILRDEVLALFGGLFPFDQFHRQPVELKLSMDIS